MRSVFSNNNNNTVSLMAVTLITIVLELNTLPIVVTRGLLITREPKGRGSTMRVVSHRRSNCGG
jgi:hypothetical protein